MFAGIKVRIAALREKLKGYKTMVWNGFVAIVPVALVALDKLAAVDLSQYMTWWMAIAVGFVVSTIGVWLRYITTGPVGAKGDRAPVSDEKGVIECG
jgi:cyanate permease